MKFEEMPYERPNMDEIFKAIEKLTQSFKKATSADEQIEIIQKLDDVNKNFETMSTLTSIRHSINTKDEFYDKENDFFNETSPLFQDKINNFNEVCVKTKFRKEIAEKFGEIYFTNMEISLKAFAPEVIPLMQEENRLQDEYQKLYAGGKIDFDGKSLTIPQMTLYMQSKDRIIRQKAYEAKGKFFDEHQEEFDRIYDSLVKNRTEQAKLLGFENYVELGYLRNTRNCYGPEGVANYRRQIIEDVVPIVKEIKEMQAKRIGVDGDFKFFDDTFMFPSGNAAPKGTPEEILAAGKEMYEKLSPETAEFINMMFDMNLFDVKSKDGKAPGGYCTYIPNYDCPFIFSNFNKTAGDVDVLTHEAGHAFAAKEASKIVPLTQFIFPTSDAAEVASMSMEFLTAPYHELFFKEETDKYELGHAEDALIFLPYGTLVDHFQHLVYENPDWTPEERNQAWAKLDKIYRPYINYDNLPFYQRGAGWQQQLHIYLYPFYYIDYCMAQTIALQIWAKSLKDWNNAWETYLKFVSQGGTKTFVDLVKSSNLLSPLENGSLKEVCEASRKWLHEKWSK